MTGLKTSEASLPHQTAAEMLRASEEKYRNLVENVNDVIFEIDATGMLTYISPAVRTVFGNEPHDLIGKRFLEFVHPEDVDLLIKRFSELTEGIEHPLEYRIRRKSGEVRYVRTYTKPIFKENIFVGASGTLIDITDRRLAEEALRISEANLRSFFHAISERVFLMKLDGEILAANESFAKGLGKDAEDVIGHCVYDYLDPSVAASRKTWINEAVRSGKPMRVEDERQNSIMVHSLYPIVNSEGAVDRIAVYTIDVTEARRSESALRESEELYRTLFENMMEGFAYCKMLYDDNGFPDDWIYLKVNTAFRILTGLSDVVGKRVTELIPGIKESSQELFEIYGKIA
ncbi:MAG: PAS domain S-box protein, partial [Pseudomonadota bacterium]